MERASAALPSFSSIGAVLHVAWLSAKLMFYSALLMPPTIIIFVWYRYLSWANPKVFLREPVKWLAQEFFNWMIERRDLIIEWTSVEFTGRGACSVRIHGFKVLNPPCSLAHAHIDAWERPNLLEIEMLHVDFGSVRELLKYCIGMWELSDDVAFGWLVTRVRTVQIIGATIFIENINAPKTGLRPRQLTSNLTLATGFESLESAGEFLEKAEERREAIAAEATRVADARIRAARLIQRAFRHHRSQRRLESALVESTSPVNKDAAAIKVQRVLRGRNSRRLALADMAEDVAGLGLADVKLGLGDVKNMAGDIAGDVKHMAKDVKNMAISQAAAARETVELTAATAKAKAKVTAKVTATATTTIAKKAKSATKGAATKVAAATNQIGVRLRLGKDAEKSRTAMRREALVPLLEIGRLELKNVRVSISDTTVTETETAEAAPAEEDHAKRNSASQLASSVIRTSVSAVQGATRTVSEYTNVHDLAKRRVEVGIARAVNSRALLDSFRLIDLYGPQDKIFAAIGSAIASEVVLRLSKGFVLGALGQPTSVAEARAAVCVQAAHRRKQAKAALMKTRKAAVSVQSAARRRIQRRTAEEGKLGTPTKSRVATPKGTPNSGQRIARAVSSGLRRLSFAKGQARTAQT